MVPSVRPPLVALAVLAFGVAGTAAWDAHRERTEIAEVKAAGEARAGPVVDALERAIGERLMMLNAFRTYDRGALRARATSGSGGMPMFASSIFKSSPGLKGALASQGGALRWMQTAPGEDLDAWNLRDSLGTLTRLAERSAPSPVAMGPLDAPGHVPVLVLAGTVPAVDGGATEVVAVVVDVATIRAQAGLDTLIPGWHVGVSTASGRYVAGNPASPDEDPVRRYVNQAGLHWAVAAAPQAGWASLTTSRTGPRLAGLVIAALVALAAWGLATVLQRKQRAIWARDAAFAHETARHEEGLRRLDLALGAAQMGIWEWAIRYDRVRWSPELGPMFGRPLKPAEMPMPTFLAYVHAEDRAMLADHISDVGRHGGRLRLSFRVVDEGGQERWLRLEGASLDDETGEPLRVLAVVADVTDRMRLEAQLQQAAKLDAVGSLAAGIAHDFGNMLMAIQASVELAAAAAETVTGPTAEFVRSDLGEARGALRHARMLTMQLMAYSRREPPRPQAVELGASIAALEPLLRRLLGTRGKLVVVANEEPVVVMIDPSQLDQVLLNLVVNARDVTPDGGRILVATGIDAANQRAWLAVEDTGPGIPEDVAPRIFDAFFTTKASGKGTGLGLATVHRIVTTAGGTVQAGNVPNGGAVFTVYLPTVERPALVSVA